MLKKNILLLFISIISFGINAQTIENTKAKLSPRTKKYLLESAKQEGKGIILIQH